MQIIQAIAKRNCIWPLQRQGKGWATATSVRRYAAAVDHLIRTKRGSLIWMPSYGTQVHQYRTTGFSEQDRALAHADIAQTFRVWLPEVMLMELKFELNPSDEGLPIHITWGIPGGVSAFTVGSTAKQRFALGPHTQTVTV